MCRIQTDDRYLASLKTIKKLTLVTDKLKVRVEALQRANTLLNTAVPKVVEGGPGAYAVAEIMAPAPSSAKKRGLPSEFVGKDPGPQAVIAGPGLQTQAQSQTGLQSQAKEVVPAGEDSAAARTVAPLPRARDSRPSTAELASGTSAVAARESSATGRQATTAARPATTPEPRAPAHKAGTNSSGKLKPSKASGAPQLTAASTAHASTKPRRPLAAVQPQAPQPASTGPTTASLSQKLGALTSSSAAGSHTAPKAGAGQRPAFKPALNVRPLPSRAASGPTDTTSLRAALQALRRQPQPQT